MFLDGRCKEENILIDGEIQDGHSLDFCDIWTVPKDHIMRRKRNKKMPWVRDGTSA